VRRASAEPKDHWPEQAHGRGEDLQGRCACSQPSTAAALAW